MTPNIREIVESHWRLANSRDWAAFGGLLSPGLRYEVPQTREYIDGGAGYLDMFATWPGDWRAVIRQLVVDERTAVSIIDFNVGDETMTGISVFEVQDGKIVKVTDYWPQAYEPAPRVSSHLKRLPP
jgi:SnoaL-like domain